MFMCLCLIFSFGMTSDYFVFLEQPIYLNLMRIFVNTLRRQPPVKNLFEHGNEEKVNKFLVHVLA